MMDSESKKNIIKDVYENTTPKAICSGAAKGTAWTFEQFWTLSPQKVASVFTTAGNGVKNWFKSKPSEDPTIDAEQLLTAALEVISNGGTLQELKDLLGDIIEGEPLETEVIVVDSKTGEVIDGSTESQEEEANKTS
jgi:hypothetical protein